jgi:DNA (cytosine-5)-methyltransferase 1
MSVDEVALFLGVTPKTVRRWENGEIQARRAYLELLKSRLSTRGIARPDPDFTFVDLFAGIGGMRLGFEAVGGKCVFTSEWDEYAQRTYRANFPHDHEIAGDITKIDAADIPKHDVLLAGFPCQPFSVAGVSKKNALGHRHGFLDKTQGTLFFDILRILKAKQPAAFLLENVKNLKSHDKRRTFEVIRGALEEDLGYHVSVHVIDAKGYLPQHRERVFIAGFRENTGFDFRKLDFADPMRGPVLASILHSSDEQPEEPYTSGKRSESGIRTVVSGRYTLTDHLWRYLQDYAEKHRAAGNGFGFGLNGPKDKARTLSARYYKDGSEILIAQKGKVPRRLTPRECARLMGFDPDRNTRMQIPVSDTRAYKQFGNAVAVPVVREVARYMKPHIMRMLDPGELFTQGAGRSDDDLFAWRAKVA